MLPNASWPNGSAGSGDVGHGSTTVRFGMPLQNRVTPFGSLIAVPARGTYMGNRGIIHDPVRKVLLSRRWQHHAWVCCRLQFKDYQHPIMGAGSYTELFFLDEVTALAAGHRPCAYCRRPAFNAFMAAWRASGESSEMGRVLRAPDVDRTLHRARATRRHEQIRFDAQIDDLPDGVFIMRETSAALVWGDRLYPWRPDGYLGSLARPLTGQVTVLTPRPTVSALMAGYRPNAPVGIAAAG